jgi:hypothetical protein
MADATEGYSDDAFYPWPDVPSDLQPETGNTGETLWGLPRDVSAFALYLNLDLLAESGAPDPRELAAEGNWNWDTFLEVAIAIDALGNDIYGYGQNAWWGPYGYWINAAGGGFFNEDRTACALDTPNRWPVWSLSPASTMSSTWPCPTAKTANRRSWPVKWACSKTAVGLPPAPALPLTSTGTSSNCRMVRPARATGSSGALTSSTPTPKTPKPPGSWCRN